MAAIELAVYGMLRVPRTPAGEAGLDDLAGVHHGDPVADVLDHGQVVGDEDQRQVQLVDEIGDEVEHLGAYGHVEGAHRLVGDEDLRAGARARAIEMRCRWPPENWCG